MTMTPEPPEDTKVDPVVSLDPSLEDDAEPDPTDDNVEDEKWESTDDEVGDSDKDE